MDGGAFFGMLFGSDKFDNLVGELVIAAATRAGKDPEVVKGQQKQRISKLVGKLRSRLSAYKVKTDFRPTR